jgi:hypothetical protein
MLSNLESSVLYEQSMVEREVNCPLCDCKHTLKPEIAEDPVATLVPAWPPSSAKDFEVLEVFLTCPKKNDTFKARIPWSEVGILWESLR